MDLNQTELIEFSLQRNESAVYSCTSVNTVGPGNVANCTLDVQCKSSMYFYEVNTWPQLLCYLETCSNSWSVKKEPKISWSFNRKAML